MKNLFFLLLALPLLATTCQKDPKKGQPVYVTEEEKLPAITQQGLNTFGCLVNGKAWLPDNDGSSNAELSPDYWNGILSISAKRFGKDKTGHRSLLESVWIDIYGIYQTGSYNKDDTATVRFYDYENSCSYHFNNILITNINISRFDTLNRIIAGNFNATLYVDSICDTLKITKGRFDVKY